MKPPRLGFLLTVALVMLTITSFILGAKVAKYKEREDHRTRMDLKSDGWS